ncbi:hypothetical protein BJV82DRAFT_623025 [Fennellomyces sp. T-0311]|nr:hypothetical protein BJV82DRAFT_623025 [Fennellomyces sp. T-0311]
MSSVRLSQRISIQRGQLLIRLRNNQCARFGTTRRNWFFRKFLSPKEEQNLYLGITAAFRQNLDKQTSESTKSYSNIIEQVILATTPTTTKKQPTLDQLQNWKVSLDQANDEATLDQLWRELDQVELSSVALYNRLIRSYIRSGSLSKAEHVFQDLKLMPTTRTFTYLIQAHVKANAMDKAKAYVEKMQYLDLRLRTAFDCNVMLKYYVEANAAHAVDILWRHIEQHIDTIKPGWAIYTLYMEWLLKSKDKALAQVLQDALGRLEHKPTTSQARVVAQAAELLNTSHPVVADRAMLVVARTAPKLVHKGTVDGILRAYLTNGQSLKAAAHYYYLRKANVPNTAIASDQTLSILERALRQQDDHLLPDGLSPSLQ